MTFLKYDIPLLLSQCNLIDILLKLGIDLNMSGNNVFMPCPEHPKRLGKKDTHNTNCVVNEKYYYCNSCGAKGDAIK